MRINWGTGLLIFIIFFVVAVFGFVLFTTSYNINLVEEDYYPKELKYGERMKKISNSYHLEENIEVNKREELIEIRFPTFTHREKPEGVIQVYRPSDYRMDKYYDIDIDDSGYQYIPRKGLLPGKYIIKIEWSHADTAYYFEETFMNR